MSVAFRSPRSHPLRIAVLISGGGTTLRNLLSRIAEPSLDAEPRLVISSRKDAGGLQFAREAGVPALALSGPRYAAPEALGQAVFDACRAAEVELVVMGGFLRFVPIPDDFAFRVVNIHPSLIPSFCGQGFHGRAVHEAALAYGVKLSGCTVHFVDNQYDHGPVILQRAVPVEDADTPAALAARVFQAECEAYPEALRLYGAGRIEVVGRRVRILPE